MKSRKKHTLKGMILLAVLLLLLVPNLYTKASEESNIKIIDSITELEEENELKNCYLKKMSRKRN